METFHCNENLTYVHRGKQRGTRLVQAKQLKAIGSQTLYTHLERNRYNVTFDFGHKKLSKGHS